MSLTRSIAVAATLFVGTAGAPALAATEAEIDTLYEAIGTPRLIEIMREEGVMQSVEDAGIMFGQSGSGFIAMAERVYDAERMADTFRAEFGEALADVDVSPLLDFFASDRGRQIIALELSAREAFMSPDVEAAAERAAADRVEDDPDRHALLTEFIDANNLVERNVMGTMNASVAYYQGLLEGGEADVSESQILSDVWNREEEIRDDTTEWLYAYLGLAYEPLADADLEAYVDVADSDAGSALNRALFEGFGAVFEEISYLLGRATFTFGQSEEL